MSEGSELLLLTLMTAVPLEIEGVRRLLELSGQTWADLVEQWRATGEVQLSEGVLYAGAGQGQTRQLIQGLALLAFAPGGVEFGPLYFNATRPFFVQRKTPERPLERFV